MQGRESLAGLQALARHLTSCQPRLEQRLVLPQAQHCLHGTKQKLLQRGLEHLPSSTWSAAGTRGMLTRRARGWGQLAATYPL